MSNDSAFIDLDSLLQTAADVLSGNVIDVNGRRYTAPSLDNQDFGRKDYANQFTLDSCFHALIWRWIDPQMAQTELLSLVSGQLVDGADAGMIPHCNYWGGGADWLWNNAHRSCITQPPLIATAAWRVFEHSKDKTFLSAIYQRMRGYHDWLDRRRDPDHDDLVCIIHPWEGGGDALPRWDKSLQLGAYSHEAGRAARINLASVVVNYDTDAAALAKDGWFHIEPMDYNAIRTADLEAIAEIARLLGKSDEFSHWQQRAAAVRAAFQAKMIVEGMPYDLSGVEETPIMQASLGQFVTLFGGCPTNEQAARLVQQLQEERFWTAFPVPTNPTNADTFSPETYFRGNVWPFTNWLVFQGLRRYGYHDLARELAQRSVKLLQQSGFWEYYHPLTGAGLGGSTFSWAAVILDMALSLRQEGS